MSIRTVNHFAETCPCKICTAWRERRGKCKAHGTPGCLECSGVLARTRIEVAWVARYYMRPVVEFLARSKSRVMKFALVCPCDACARWRGRMLDITEGSERDGVHGKS